MDKSIDLGPTPLDEECAQFGSANFAARAYSECVRFKNFLKRKFPPVDDTFFSIKKVIDGNAIWYGVVINYNPNNKKAKDFALHIANNLPKNWDD